MQVDLLVPEAVGGRTGRRGARLGVHGNRAARQVRGLEGALVSRRPMLVGALRPGDGRAFEINVAGPAALLVAKVHKLAERIDADDDRRISNKDAFDIFRLLQAVDTAELIRDINTLAGVPVSREAPGRRWRGSRSRSGLPRPPAPNWLPTTWLAREPGRHCRIQCCPQLRTDREDNVSILMACSACQWPTIIDVMVEKFPVGLTGDEKRGLKALVSKGSTSPYKQTHARVLLLSDESKESTPLNNQDISRSLRVGAASVQWMRSRWAEQRSAAVRDRKRIFNLRRKSLDGGG